LFLKFCIHRDSFSHGGLKKRWASYLCGAILFSFHGAPLPYREEDHLKMFSVDISHLHFTAPFFFGVGGEYSKEGDHPDHSTAGPLLEQITVEMNVC
jgi:hypothetical protein